MDSSRESMLLGDDQSIERYGSGLGEFGRARCGSYTHWIWREMVLTCMFGEGGFEQAMTMAVQIYGVDSLMRRL